MCCVIHTQCSDWGFPELFFLNTFAIISMLFRALSFNMLDNLLKFNRTNSISKNTLRDKRCPWLINCTTKEYLVNMGQDSLFNMSPHV